NRDGGGEENNLGGDSPG
ncbi:oligopeptidase B, partial [Mycobacterium montefiorense]